MRLQHWFTAIMSVLASLVVSTATQAQPWQTPPPPSGAHAAYPGAGDPSSVWAPTAPPLFQPAFSNNDPTVLYPPQTPPDFYPSPEISPHLGPNIVRDATFSRDGLWFREMLQRDREYYGSLEYVQTKFDSPGSSLIGSRIAPIRRDSGDFNTFIKLTNLANPLSDSGNLTGTDALPIGPGAFPYVFLQDAIPGFAGTAIIGSASWPIRTASKLGDMDTGGLRARWGFFNSEGSGVGLETWWASEGQSSFQVGQAQFNGVPVTQSMVVTTGGVILLAKVGALPLEENSGAIDTLFPGSGFTGTTQKYDLLWRIESNMEAAGGNLYLYTEPVYRRGNMRVTPYLSGRYMFLREYFGFHGIDSGFHYEVDDETGDATFRPVDFDPTLVLYPLLDSRLTSTVHTHLAGPEIGTRLDLGGGRRFKLWGQASVGVMAAYEEFQVQGVNIGNAHFFSSLTPFTGDPGQFGNLSPALDMLQSDTTFNDKETHTSVSPVLQWSLHTETNLRDFPFGKRLAIFGEPRLTTGFQITFIGSLPRAVDSVDWRGFPEFPSVNVEHTTYTIQQFDIGLEWTR